MVSPQDIRRVLKQCKPVLNAIEQAGGRPLIVGGAVRDLLMGNPSNDIDIEVYGLDVERLIGALALLGSVNAVGRSFGVLKVRILSGLEIDVALPQRGSRNPGGQRGAIPAPDPR